MKKTILYLSLLSTLTLPPAAAMENDREILQAKKLSLVEELEKIETDAAIELSLKTQKITELKSALEQANNEKVQEIGTKAALRREITALEREQADTNQLIHDTLCQHLLFPQNGIVSKLTDLSEYQQNLLPQRDKIGPIAWAALSNKNEHLSAALYDALQTCLGQAVEIFYLGENNFKLRISLKEQNHPYKY